jgi:hypothetical protein
VDNIKINLRKIEWHSVDWIHLAEDRDQWEGSCKYGDEPSGSIKWWKFLMGCTIDGFSKGFSCMELVIM